MNNQLPPSSIEAEEAFLGGMLFDPKLVAKFEEILPVKAFYVGSHQTIYQSMISVAKQGNLPDLVMLSTYMEAHKSLDLVGGTTKLARLLNQSISALNCDRYAKLIMEKYQRREIISIGYQITDLGYDQTVELSQLCEQIKELLPESIKEIPQVDSEPIVTKAKYTVISQSGNKQLELEADVTDGWNLADSIANIAAKAKIIAESLWGENIE